MYSVCHTEAVHGTEIQSTPKRESICHILHPQAQYQIFPECSFKIFQEALPSAQQIWLGSGHEFHFVVPIKLSPLPYIAINGLTTKYVEDPLRLGAVSCYWVLCQIISIMVIDRDPIGTMKVTFI